MSATRPKHASSPIADVMADLGVRTYDDAWWKAREERFELERQQQAEAEARAARGRRAVFLQAPGKPGFPRKVVDEAMALDGHAEIAPALSLARAFAREREQALSYQVGLRTVLVLAGGTGTGKTTAATWLALNERDESPVFLRAVALARLTRYGMERKLEELLQATSWVIDDLGTEHLSETGIVEATIGELFDVAHSNCRLLVVTTNLKKRRERQDDLPGFVERYGARMESRMKQSGRWVDCGATDLRGAVRS